MLIKDFKIEYLFDIFLIYKQVFPFIITIGL